MTPMTKTPVSPKVPAATLGGAAATVLAYLLGTLPVIDGWPEPVRAALLVLLMAAGAWVAGWLKADVLRNIGADVIAGEEGDPHAPPLPEGTRVRHTTELVTDDEGQRPPEH